MWVSRSCLPHQPLTYRHLPTQAVWPPHHNIASNQSPLEIGIWPFHPYPLYRHGRSAKQYGRGRFPNPRSLGLETLKSSSLCFLTANLYRKGILKLFFYMVGYLKQPCQLNLWGLIFCLTGLAGLPATECVPVLGMTCTIELFCTGTIVASGTTG